MQHIQTDLKKYLALAAASFFGFSLVCILLKPQSLALNDGLSYFGNYKTTILPYTCMLLVTAYLLFQVLIRLPDGKLFPAWLKNGFLTIIILLVGLLLTPSNAGFVADHVHQLFGAAIFIIELVASAFWWMYNRNDNVLLLLLVILLMSGIASAIYVPTAKGFLLQTQLIYQAAFLASFARVLT